jgi:hypothetical protein
MTHYLTQAAIRWAMDTLVNIPRDQSCLLYFLILTKKSTVKKGGVTGMTPFEEEFYRYFGAPIKGGGVGCFNPFDKRWMAEDYISSTVFGRLLNGSHWWTDGDEGFFSRNPGRQFPAEMDILPNAFERLQDRTTYPCLKPGSLLPMTAVSVWYYRGQPVEIENTTNMNDLVKRLKADVLDLNPDLHKLFFQGGAGPLNPFSDEPLSEEEMLAIYPVCPFAGEPKTNVRLYVDDVNTLRSAGVDVNQIADYFRQLIRDKGI